MDFLTKLFSSAALPKVLRLFVFNPTTPFDREGVVERTRVHPDDASYELGLLSRCGIIKKKTFFKERLPKTKNARPTRRKAEGYIIDEKSPYIIALRDFLLGTTPLTDAELIKKISVAGKLKLIVIGGIFLGEWEQRVDMLVVGESLDTAKLLRVVRDLEAYIGREIRYSSFSVDDYRYRRNLHDKLIRDVFDFPHRIILDRLGS